MTETLREYLRCPHCRQFLGRWASEAAERAALRRHACPVQAERDRIAASEARQASRAADMADIACRICHHAESDHTRAHAVKKYGFDTRQACTQCACVEWVAPKEVESVDDVAAVDLIDDLDDARRTMSSVEFDDDLYARTRDFILDAVSENQRLNAVLAHRTAQLDRLTLAKRGS